MRKETERKTSRIDNTKQYVLCVKKKYVCTRMNNAKEMLTELPAVPDANFMEITNETILLLSNALECVFFCLPLSGCMRRIIRSQNLKLQRTKERIESSFSGLVK